MAREQVGVGIRTVCKKLNFSDNFTEREKRIGVSTVRRYVKTTACGKTAYKERMKPLLSQNIDDRARFCERMVNECYASEGPDGRIQRAHILFTDESPVELHPKPNRQNRRIRTEDPKKIPQVLVPKFTLKIMVAGGISRYGKTALLIVDQGKTVDGEYYRSNILPTYVNALKNAAQFPRPQHCVLMQDGAKAHLAKVTVNVLEHENVRVWTDWPGNSPDLNVIEHVGAVLQDSVFEEPRPKNREQLVNRVTEEWDALSWEYLTSLVERFGPRVRDCLPNDGKNTKYWLRNCANLE